MTRKDDSPFLGDLTDPLLHDLVRKEMAERRAIMLHRVRWMTMQEVVQMVPLTDDPNGLMHPVTMSVWTPEYHSDPDVVYAWRHIRVRAKQSFQSRAALEVRTWCMEHLTYPARLRVISWTLRQPGNDDAKRRVVLFGCVGDAVISKLAWHNVFESMEDF